MEISSTEVRNNFDTYLKLAQIEDVYIIRGGNRVAVLKYWEEPCRDFTSVAEANTAYLVENPRLTVEEFQKLADASENRYELIDGEVFQLASPSYTHQRIIGEIFNKIYQWSQGKKCKPVMAPFDVTLIKEDNNKSIVQPDLVVGCDSEKIDPQGRYYGMPSVVVEVLSEATRSKDMVKKLNLYMASGIGEYWMVEPWNREVYIYSFASGEIQNYRIFKENESACSEVLENLNIPVKQVFAS